MIPGSYHPLHRVPLEERTPEQHRILEEHYIRGVNRLLAAMGVPKDSPKVKTNDFSSLHRSDPKQAHKDAEAAEVQRIAAAISAALDKRNRNPHDS